MNKIKLESLSIILRLFLSVTFVVGLLVTLTLPMTLEWFFTVYDFETYTKTTDWHHYYSVLLTLMPCGVFSLVILHQLIAIVKTAQKNPFIHKNVRCFNIIGVCCFLITISFTILFALYPTAFTFALAYVFLVLGLASLVFGQLFKKAVDFKQENDLTI